ncbi:MAG: branched-chain amino acid aminotransferase [Deltaproteobacteria bacterium]|nr:branched-chain amino acid aminotransferase [Deltaproteobacteria bacterium]
MSYMPSHGTDGTDGLHIDMRHCPSPPILKGRIEDVEFGTMFTPNMFMMRYHKGEWKEARVEPVTEIRLHPGATVLHYAQEVFEGLKAFRQTSGDIVLFRPEMNARRINESAKRLSMPSIPEPLFLEAVRRLVEVERNNVPPAPGCLYIRPTLIGVTPLVKVSPANEFLFYILTLVTGPYFKGTSGRDAGAVNVFVAQSVTRASRGGMGAVKAGANYSGTLEITAKAFKAGCAQVLFLDARDETRIEEMGGMNVCFVADGALVTPPLSGTILPGITRDSLMTIARGLGIPAREEPLDIVAIIEGLESGRVTEAMACGTAAVVTGIKSFQFEDGRVVNVPGPTPGPVSTRLFDAIRAIQYGDCPDENGWIRTICRGETATD